jgi:hypothetical protein
MTRNQEKIKRTLLITKPKKEVSLKEILSCCGIKEKRSLACTKNLTTYGEALTKSRVVQVQIPSTWRQWKERF